MSSKERIARALAISTDTKVFEMGRDMSVCAAETFMKCFPGRKAVIVSDTNTWRVLGERVYAAFVEAGIPAVSYIIGKEEFHAHWQYVEMTDLLIEGRYDEARAVENASDHVESDRDKAFIEPSEDYNILVAVGSGTINDLCKLSSYHYGQQYLTLPTAASVDGYSAFGASITYHGSKQTFSCPAPLAIVADVDVIAEAPKEMTAAGYADLAAKIPAGAEWILADAIGVEPLHPQAWPILQDYLDGFLSDPQGVAEGDPDAVADLFEGLILSGFAMQAARSSRPASCSDHLFSHILDMTDHRFNGKTQSHGFQVAVGTLTMCAVLDLFLKLDFSDLDVDACVEAWPTLEQEQERALHVFRDLPAPRLGYEVISQKYSTPDEVRAQLTALKKDWQSIKERIAAKSYPFVKMQALFKTVEAPYDPAHIGVSRSQLKDLFPVIQLMRTRYNVFDLAMRGGFYESLVEPLFAEGGAWEINS